MTLDDVRRVLTRPVVPRSAPRHAAVAMVILPDLDLFFIRRAQRDSDPWSGHVAFPGGMVAEGEGPFEAALRETDEEVGIRLRGDEYLGPLDIVEPVRGLPTLCIHPFVFALPEVPVVRPNHEVATTLRYPLAHLLDGRHRGVMPHPLVPTAKMACVDFDGVRLWGLTLRIVDDLLDRLDGRGLGLDRPRAEP
jgi:8-oxo-dGTP pyrophosphatase MutT (NUDIX family)